MICFRDCDLRFVICVRVNCVLCFVFCTRDCVWSFVICELRFAICDSCFAFALCVRACDFFLRFVICVLCLHFVLLDVFCVLGVKIQ